MRCPKCHYLSFDPDPRCKNCGYDLEIESDADDDVEEARAESLDLRMVPAEITPTPAPDLPLRSPEITPAASKPVTLELVKPVPAPPLPPLPVVAPAAIRREPAPQAVEPALALVGVASELAPVRQPPHRSSAPTTELPLFVKTMGPQEMGAFAGLVETIESDDEDEDKVAEVEPTPPAPMHVPPTQRPLSVRRPVAEQARTVAPPQRRPGPLDHDLLEDLQRLEREEAFRPVRRPSPRPHAASASGAASESPVYEPADVDVAMSARAGAAALDGLLLGGIGAFVLWATLKVAGVSPAALGLASLLPMGVFLAGVSVAYLLMFTAAGGQTVGKMLMGIRVVADADSEDDRVTIAQAASRAVLAPISVLALGLGWLPALFGRGLALHDRLSHTRVVRA